MMKSQMAGKTSTNLFLNTTMRRLAARWLTGLSAIVLIGITGCASTSEGIVDENARKDIRWLTDQLQSEGVFTVERGYPNPTIPADNSSRIYLNGREAIDVYGFEGEERARLVATEYAGMNPENDVFLKDSLVIVRYSRRDTGLNGVLYQLLGAAL